MYVYCRTTFFTIFILFFFLYKYFYCYRDYNILVTLLFIIKIYNIAI